MTTATAINARTRIAARLVIGAVLLALTLGACASTNDDDARAPATTAALVADNTPRNVTVQGAVVWDGNGARLCESLMESYPAQCGGVSVDITNPDRIDADFDETGGVRWTPGFISLTGRYDGTTFTIE